MRRSYRRLRTAVSRGRQITQFVAGYSDFDLYNNVVANHPSLKNQSHILNNKHMVSILTAIKREYYTHILYMYNMVYCCEKVGSHYV